MNKWSVVVLFLDTCVFIHGVYVDSRCYSTNTCHRHRLICNEGNLNWKIAITEAKYGFKTSLCVINGCDQICCKEEIRDCFEPFSKTPSLQKLLYDKCEFEKECKLDDPHRIGGCNGGRSTYSRIEYDCIEETDILRTTGYKNQKFVSLLFNGSDPEFPDAGISCSIRTTGLLRVIHYYTRLAGERSGDAKSEFFDATDCTTGYKMFVQNNDGPMFMCHNGGEFFYTQPIEIKESRINLNLVINRLDDNDVIWLGLFDPQSNGHVVVNCTNLDRLTLTMTTDNKLGPDGTKTKDTDTAIYIGIGVGLLVICILVVVLGLLIKRRSKSKKGPILKYSEVAVDDHDEGNHYASADDDHTDNRNNEISHKNTASKSKNCDDGYVDVDKEYLMKNSSASTSATVTSKPTGPSDDGTYTYVDQDYLGKKQEPSKVSVVELKCPDSNTYSHVEDPKSVKTVANENQGPVYSAVNKQKKISKPKNDEHTVPDLKTTGDNSNLETDNTALEEEYNHLSALTSKSRTLQSDNQKPNKIESDYDHMDGPEKVQSPSNVDQTYSHVN